jgi:hypothetical protein
MVLDDVDINNYINQIANVLDVSQDIKNQLIVQIKGYTNFDKLSFIKDTQDRLAELITADQQIELLKIQMSNNGGYDETTWNSLMSGLTKLQVLSLINKNGDCKETTDAIINALDAKIKAVNSVLVTNLNPPRQRGGNIKSYKHKYLKYKSKYLRIKNNI